MKDAEFPVSQDDAGKRADIVAAAHAGVTRSQIQRFMDKGLVTVNGTPVKPNYRMRTGEIIRVSMPREEDFLVPQDLPVEILYRDDSLVVVNKPADMVVYPASGHKSGTLMNAIAYHCKKLASVGAPLRPGIVHRLDKDTSGVMVVALDDTAYYDLIEQFRKRTISRRYQALVYGNLKEEKGEISSKIGRSVSDRKKMSTRTRRGKEAVTTWSVMERFQSATLIKVRLGTGRTHQIRVHMASLGYPVLGDRTYGRKLSLEINRQKIVFPRQMLHAEMLGFVHPETGAYHEFTCGLPPDMKDSIERLRSTSR